MFPSEYTGTYQLAPVFRSSRYPRTITTSATLWRHGASQPIRAGVGIGLTNERERRRSVPGQCFKSGAEWLCLIDWLTTRSRLKIGFSPSSQLGHDCSGDHHLSLLTVLALALAGFSPQQISILKENIEALSLVDRGSGERRLCSDWLEVLCAGRDKWWWYQEIWQRVWCQHVNHVVLSSSRIVKQSFNFS